MAMRCSLGIPWAVGLASVYRKGALISVPAAVGRTPISPTETTLAAKSPLVGRVDHSGAFTRTPAHAFAPLPGGDRSRAARYRSEERRVGKEGRSRWSPY